MAMGIDQEIQRRMDAYRGNPQALQQRYQMSQQLLDLLALQKLKSEKDAMARQMQAQMQQMPGTVAQQMEQEMVGRAKNELLQQVGGTMRTQAARQQQNAARMAQAMARPQAGIAGLAPQTAQPARRMAGGGVVAFQEGGGPLGQNPLREGMTLTDMQIGLMSNEELAQAANEGKVSPEYVKQEIQARVGRSPLERAEDFFDKLTARAQQFRRYPIEKIKAMPQGIGAVYDYLTTPTRESVPPTPPLPVAATAGTTALPAGVKGVTPPPEPEEDKADAGAEDKTGTETKEPTYTRSTAPDIKLAAPKGLGALRTGAKGLMEGAAPTEEALLKKYSGILGLDRLREQREGRLAELAALDKAQLDPEKLRQERVLRKFAAAGAGRSMAQTQADVILEQEKRERDRLVQRQKIADEIDAAELGMNKDLLTQSLRTVEGAKNMKIKGMEMLRNLGRDEFDRAKAQAEVQWNQYKEDNAERFREYTALSDAANRALRAAQVDESALSRLINDIGTLYADEREAQRALLEQDQRYLDLISEEDRTPEQEAELQQMRNAADATALAIVDEAKLLDLQDDLAARLLRRMGMARSAR